MKKLKRLIVPLLLLLAALAFLITITDMPTVSAGGTFCDDGAELYCWISFPYWECLEPGGIVHCVNKPQDPN